MMATLLVFSTMMAVGQGHSAEPARMCLWLLTLALGALNLTGFGGRLRPRTRRLNALLDDETTRDHRRTSLAAGFWAALLSGSVMSVVGAIFSLSCVDGVRVVITAALVAALIAFATQELRAVKCDGRA
ncbi:hypothetical protein [Brytella acorum]|uniref:Uncharacterized protein n=1 Tax=Brytella acorum TaxID=2959299 RepID=A0AA35Y372_9PROT|nr:hypothetical protein [Brytella acorum]MDF3623434.1 hypothetical protein [Brytella acorum]CAI9120541.1 hypothetical protein LMG32879_001374 [Brytella acorum]